MFMDEEQIITIVTNILTSGGVATFLWFLIRGLHKQIGSLNKTIEAQNKTLEVMEKRVSETERVGDIYKSLISELPDYIEKYKSIISVTRDEMIAELEKANQLKDEKLKSMTEIELKKLDIQEQIITELPKLRDELLKTQRAINQRFDTIRLFLVAGSESETYLRESRKSYYQVKWNRWNTNSADRDALRDWYYHRLLDYVAHTSRQLTLFEQGADEKKKEENDNARKSDIPNDA
jgi:hypothetical protein